MQLYTIDTGFFKLDGGAMFGVVPKSLWQSLNPPDENNLCTWAMRCLLVEEGKRLMLIDTGIGDKQDERFRSYFQPHGEETLLGSLKKQGFSPDDVTDVLLTHLHFDHCGGAIQRDGSGKLTPVFKNATYWASGKHWDWAIHPNAREKASFLTENILPIKESGQLKFTEVEELVFPGISLDYVNGHTEAMVIAHLKYRSRTISYVADLIPSSHHIRMPYVMAYDVRPLTTLTEKAILLERAIVNDHILLFEHDPVVECCSLIRTDRGIAMDQALMLKDL